MDSDPRRPRRGVEPVGRRAEIDGIRGVAALSVFGFHVWLYTLPVVSASRRTTVSDYALHELRLGLVLFFVLSAYLLYAPWAAGERGPRTRTFLRARAARILPGYWLALAGSVALLWGLSGTPGVRLPPAESLGLFAILGQNTTGATVMKLDPPMWTLAVEATFYLCLPALGALAGRLRGGPIVVPLALAAAGVTWNHVTHANGLGMTWTKTFPAMAPYFACGMLAVVAARRLPAQQAARRVVVLAMAAGLALVLADALGQSAQAAHAPRLIPVVLRDLPAAAGFALILWALPATGALRRLLATRPIAAIGTVSFGLYLWHVPVLLWLRGNSILPLSPVGATLVAIPVSLLLATVSWHLVERPAIRLARRTGPKGILVPARSWARALTSSGTSPH